MASTLEGRKRNSDDGLITPTTPKRTRRTTRHIEDLSPLNQPTNNIIKSRELIDCFITTISHRECCPEGGTFSYHKGIEPGYPKGHYCCQNACMSSGKELLLKYIGPYYLVCGSYGPLGCVGPEHSSAIRQKIADMGGDTAVEIEVNGFSCFTDDVSLKRIPGSYPPKFLPSTLTWRVSIAIYTSTHNSLTPRHLSWGDDLSGWNSLTQISSSELDGRTTPPSRTLLIDVPQPYPRPTTPPINDRSSNYFCSSPRIYLTTRSRHNTLYTR